MKETENKFIKTEIVTEVICDCCGSSCKTNAGFEFLELKTVWGFMSNKDLEKWEAHICEKCVDEKLNFIKFEKISIA